MAAEQDTPVLEVSDLRTEVRSRTARGTAVDGISFTVHRGETLGLMGESGSGKTLAALSVIGLCPQPAAGIVGGSVRLNGSELVGMPRKQLNRLRGNEIAMIFQDPLTALHPALTVGTQLARVLRTKAGLRTADVHRRQRELLRELQIPDPEQKLRAYPHQLSGGTRQRIVGAIALAAAPRLLIADEPTTSLDVTVQAAYLAMLRAQQRRRGLAMLFITHDFGVAARICDRIAVMYRGQIVEEDTVGNLLTAPDHPYSRALLDSADQVADRDGPGLTTIPGEPPSVFARQSGCRFAERCPAAESRCVRHEPPVVPKRSGSGYTRCWLGADDDNA
ncbi:ABC transporter ATP-binding protein [Nocardia sp. BMG51109]|uniref:ABC transporter ATP-binding protein n=1 Tax=Nocardia sp. BMG51109 TaxID=1056816 RepID=UPI00046670C2|nr:ABC transporter ATP-binding protein [Nocardia sp. BMG51109]